MDRCKTTNKGIILNALASDRLRNHTGDLLDANTTIPKAMFVDL